MARIIGRGSIAKAMRALGFIPYGRDWHNPKTGQTVRLRDARAMIAYSSDR